VIIFLGIVKLIRQDFKQTLFSQAVVRIRQPRLSAGNSRQLSNRWRITGAIFSCRGKCCFGMVFVESVHRIRQNRCTCQGRFESSHSSLLRALADVNSPVVLITYICTVLHGAAVPLRCAIILQLIRHNHPWGKALFFGQLTEKLIGNGTCPDVVASGVE